MSEPSEDTVRLDKWLWAARFFKTRAHAAIAIGGGKIQVNGTRVKRAKLLQAGDQVRVRKGPYEYRVTVLLPSGRRLSPKEVASLYSESDSSRLERERLVEQHRLAASVTGSAVGRPTKKERRQIRNFKDRE